MPGSRTQSALCADLLRQNFVLENVSSWPKRGLDKGQVYVSDFFVAIRPTHLVLPPWLAPAPLGVLPLPDLPCLWIPELRSVAAGCRPDQSFPDNTVQGPLWAPGSQHR